MIEKITGYSMAAYVETYGCQMNISDGELMEGILSKAGYEIVGSPESADVILVNTCAIREHAETRVLGRVGQLNMYKNFNPDLVLGVTGCMAQRMKDTLLDRAPYVDLVVGPDGYRELPAALDQIRAGGSARTGRKRLAVVELSIDEDYRGLEQRRRSGVNAWVPIQRGCNHRCTFCIVPYVRGPEKNRHFLDILMEVRELALSGITEVTLLGQTVNSYTCEDWNFARLLRAVSEVPRLQRVRFTSPHPVDFTPELVEVITDAPTVCEHIHLPVQSGSNAVLKRMLRRYTIEKYLELVAFLRKKMPRVALSTDVIVGFPGETDEDFEQTLDVIRKVRFDEVFTYKYSPRDGTPATRLPEHQFIPRDIAQRRLEELIALSRRIQREINLTEVGKYKEILVERMGRFEGTILGRTRRNKVVVAKGVESDVGKYIGVKVAKTTGATFFADRLPEPPPHYPWPPLPPNVKAYPG